MVNLDKKDYQILRELDINFRYSLSKIAKKVGLSKNSVALRFKKLQKLMLHNVTGIDHLIMGYTKVKIFYTLTDYDESLEKEIEKEVKKHNNIMWAAKYFGPYDLEICMFVKTLEQLISQMSAFDRKFRRYIGHRDLILLEKDFYFRHNFLHQRPLSQVYEILSTKDPIKLNDTEKKIILGLRDQPRIEIIELSEKLKINPQTIVNYIKKLTKQGVIMGYFMKLDLTQFGVETYKLLVQLQNTDDFDRYEKYLCAQKDIAHISKMLGLWDYEIDILAKNTSDLHEKINDMRKRFPGSIKEIKIMSFEKRIATNQQKFLL